MNLNITYDSSANSAPAGFKSAITYAVQYLDSLFTDNVTININVGWGKVAGQNLSAGALGQSSTFLSSYSYTQIKNALAADATSANDSSALASLPGTNPTGSGNFWLTTAEAKALGLAGASASLDGYCGFSSTASWTFDPNNRAVAGCYDFIGTFEHEISEIMGRIALDGTSIGSTTNSYSALDLFRFSAPGTRNFVGTHTGYFSVNGGTTNLDSFNTNPNGDFGDWAASAGNDAALAFSNSGVMNAFSAADITAMDVLGYNTTSAPPAVPNAVAVADFNGDLMGDILFNNGTVSIWEMNGTQVLATATVAQVASNWHVAGIGDFNGDGKSDIIWRTDDGSVGMWELNGGQTLASINYGGIGAAWHIAGIGDLNGDHKSDVLWRNDDGSVAFWQMNGTQIVGARNVGGIGPEWQIQGLGDFNGDGMSDVLWRKNDGTIAFWEMNGTQILAALAIGQVTSDRHVVGIGDFNGDHMSDILFHDDNGSVMYWEISGTQVLASVSLGQMTSDWRVAGVGDFNKDGMSDILWQNTTTNTLQIWEVSGSQILANQTVAGTQNLSAANASGTNPPSQNLAPTDPSLIADGTRHESNSPWTGASGGAGALSRLDFRKVAVIIRAACAAPFPFFGWPLAQLSCPGTIHNVLCLFLQVPDERAMRFAIPAPLEGRRCFRRCVRRRSGDCGACGLEATQLRLPGVPGIRPPA